jgi:hypothetical protein
LLLAVVAAPLWRPVDAPARDTPVTVDADGRWTLARLGSGQLDVPVDRGPAAVTVRYRLPRGASQGPRTWYLIRLHFEITFAADSGPGIAYVSGLTNGRAAAQIKYRVTKRPNAAPEIRWSSVDLIRGRIERTAASRTVEVRFRNYLQLGGVRPGNNTLTVELERLRNVEVKRLRIFADSGIEVTRLAPAKLVLKPVLPVREVNAGEEFRVGFTLDNDGGRPARDVIVGVDFPRRVLTLLGPVDQRVARVRRRLTGSFRFRALRPGRYRLALAVRSSANRPLAVIDVPVSSSESSRAGRRLVSIIAGALIVGFGLLLLLGGGRWRRRASR